jgi:glycosyltransferase involved in cell wall biosynthesis
MKITQAVFGTFHHFDLARELESRGHLQTIYSTFPWRRLRREGVSRDKVKTFPWVHTPEFVLARAKLLPRWLQDEMGYFNALSFDEYLNRQIEDCDALVAIAGAGLKTGRRLQAQGAKFICDRGSTHSRFQEEIVNEEQRRWGVEVPVSDIRDTLREEKIYEVCDAITVPAGFARQSYIDLGVPAEKVHVIPYGVRLERFSPTHTPPDDRFEVLFVGGVTTRKGLPYLLQAFSRLRHPAKRLRIVGGMPNWMKPVLDRLPMENVEILGILPQAELPAVMSGSHAMVLPSIEEGLALVQGQALACGCPVIATPNTGSEDLFSDEVEGFIVPMRDPDALLDRLQRLVDDPALQRRMRQAALDRVKHLGGWSTYGDKWEKLLKELTGKA